ncbi:lipid-A-disaccharide synthase N-terminal domain-containing protein [Proteiniphilum acetatigenes]|uniref:lipid-A-disaccharide synthase N-terminal domain-containing protein n=1 Tax=Proteiniphilum acetatigenes TaxID=294710 RepID=UPI000366E56C|nr:lipid-A-disaccharide synthase N-terminal domain-containing protein [Proteiniphilum acetatigenes]SFK95977.1 Lipid A Biosynthesis N-terminal domain-containing protein [Porphyromonadaceae bacterium KH3CP3RA]
MQGTTIWIYGIGFLAQIFFSARILCQWIVTEKAKKIISPPIFWILSIFGSYLLFIYGVLRNDFAIIFGQFIAYYIYLWNLNMQGIWKRIHVGLKAILLLTPVIAVALLMRDMNAFTTLFFRQKDIPIWLLIFGSAGQVLFTFRFIYQWVYSAHLHRSVLPIGFWIISLLGSGIIVAYGIIRHDPVLILGQSVGFVAYVRNIMIGLQTKTSVPI